MKATTAKVWRKALKITAWTLGGIALLLVLSFALLNTSYVQNKLMGFVTDALSDELHTRVSVDKVSVTFLTHDIKLKGFTIEDRQQRKMLQVEQAVADVDLWPLLRNEVHISDLELQGVEARLYKASPDTAANYQFVIDAFKTEDTGGKKMKITLEDVDVERVNVSYNSDTLALGSLAASLGDDFTPTAVEARGLSTMWKGTGREGNTVDHKLDVERLKYETTDSVPLLDLEKAHYKCDNHLPRKNTGKPHRGYFDPGHLDLTVTMQLAVDCASGDTLHAVVKKCEATDSVTGIDIRDLQCTVAANRRAIDVHDLVVKQTSTQVRIGHVNFVLPDAERGVPFSFRTSTITANAILKDISRPFAPILKHFTLPVQVSATMSGSEEKLTIGNAVVKMAGGKFEVSASGTVTGFLHGERHELHVHFDVPRMRARSGVVQQIVSQFVTKMFMEKQLRALGDISYSGSFDVYWKREQFRGQLDTQVGTLKVDLEVNGLDKYLTGNVRADNIKLGNVIDVSGLGDASLSADFKFDIAHDHAAAGGKLPVGEVTARVDEVSYRFITVKNVDVSITSDGATAEGTLVAPHKFLDLSCSFTFNDTDELHNLKIKPGISLHKAS